MPSVPEERFIYNFPSSWVAKKYDQTPFYLKHFQSYGGGRKAVDVLAFGPQTELWLIEQKDYRQGSQISSIQLFQAMADKVADTLACLLATRSRAQPGSQCEILASKALKRPNIRCVLHVEQPRTNSKLFRQVIDPVNARIKLRQVLKAVDKHAEIGDKSSLNSIGFQWNIT